MPKVYKLSITLPDDAAAFFDAEKARGMPLAQIAARAIIAYLPKLYRPTPKPKPAKRKARKK